MTDLCAYLTTFFCSISQGLNREKRRVPFADTIGTAVQTALPFLSTANRVIQYYGESLCIVFHTTFSVINIIYTREQLYINIRSLQSPTIYRKRWTLRFLACPCIKDRTYELGVSRTLMLYLRNNHLTMIFFDESWWLQQVLNLGPFSCLYFPKRVVNV